MSHLCLCCVLISLSIPSSFIVTADQDTCDATQSEDGSKCVWCTVATFGVCVSEDIAEKMKEQIPGLDCDDDNNNDDDATDDATDDKAPVTDDTAPNDDSVPGKACIEDCMRRKSVEKTWLLFL